MRRWEVFPEGRDPSPAKPGAEWCARLKCALKHGAPHCGRYAADSPLLSEAGWCDVMFDLLDALSGAPAGGGVVLKHRHRQLEASCINPRLRETPSSYQGRCLFLNLRSATPARCDRRALAGRGLEQAVDLPRVERLDDVVIEPRLRRALLIGLLPPAGDGDQK